MMLLRYLIVSTALVSSGANAIVDAFSDSVYDVGGLEFTAPTCRSKLIAECSKYAAMAYNPEDLVKIKSNPLRKQKDFGERADLIEQGYELFTFSASTAKGNIPTGYIAYKEDEVVLAFNGSESREDFTKVNLWARQRQNPYLDIKDGYFHEGFNTRYLESRDAIYALIEAIGKPIKNIKVTGHSKGGAIAQIAALDLKENLPEYLASKGLAKPEDKDLHIDVVAFSSPKVFNTVAADYFAKRIGENRLFLIQREDDVVPMLPPEILGFKHAVDPIYIGPIEAEIYSLANHKFESIKKDLTSDVLVPFDQKKIGWKTVIKNSLSTAAYGLKSGLESLCKKVASLFKFS